MKTPDSTVASILAHCRARGASVASAESCTGGLIATALTAQPGSSAVYRGGVSAYANEAKTALLGVEPAMIAAHGAVSEAVAAAMARGVRERLAATHAVAVTGIAGPDGGTPEKPVGTVWVGLARAGAARAVLLNLTGTREEIRLDASRRALALLLSEIETP